MPTRPIASKRSAICFSNGTSRKREIKNGYRLVSTALQDTDAKYHLTNRKKAELTLLKHHHQHRKVSFEQELQDTPTQGARAAREGIQPALVELA